MKSVKRNSLALVEPLSRVVFRGLFMGSAVAMGYVRKPKYSRFLPEVLIVHIIVARYRKKSSWWFLIYHTILRPRAIKIPGWLPELKTMSKADMFKTQALYSALIEDIGQYAALAVIGEILRALQVRRLKSSRQKTKKTPRRKS